MKNSNIIQLILFIGACLVAYSCKKQPIFEGEQEQGRYKDLIKKAQTLDKKKKGYEEAIIYADEALTINDKSGEAYRIKAHSYSKLYKKKKRECESQSKIVLKANQKRRNCNREKRSLRRKKNKLEDQCKEIARMRDTTSCDKFEIVEKRFWAQDEKCNDIDANYRKEAKHLDSLRKEKQVYYNKSVKNYELAIKEEGDGNTILAMAYLYQEEGDSIANEMAIDYFKKYTKKNRKYRKEAYYAIARLNMIKNDYKEAKKYARKSWKIYQRKLLVKRISLQGVDSEFNNNRCDCKFLYGMAKFQKHKGQRGKRKMMTALDKCLKLRRDVKPRKKLIETYRLHDAFETK